MTGEFAAAVHALVYLNHKNTTLTSDELAENVCTNPARMRKIMARLKKAELVTTKEGAEGGYFFPHNAKKVNLKMISDAFDLTIVSSNWKSGDEGMECLVASGMAVIMDGIYNQLDGLCKDRLEKITIYSIERYIFGQDKQDKNKKGNGENGKENTVRSENV